jgi:mono/diheme cytochrome c family protein
MKSKKDHRRSFVSSPLVVLLCAFALLQSCANQTSPEEQPDAYTILKATNLRPLKDVTYESTPQRIARGKYLMEGPLWCFQCHTERDKEKAGWPPMWEKKGSGAEISKTDSTHLYAPNITPDKKTGIGSLTDDMVARAIREGVGHDDRSLSTMPWWTFRLLTDEDVASIVTYLRTIPAITNKIPRRHLTTKGEENLKSQSVPLMASLVEPNLADVVDRGKYLIGVADCIGCHTGWYARNPGVFGGGNPMDHNADHVFSSNISSDSTGIGAWPVETFIYVIRNGKGKSGTLNKLMPWTSFKNMSDEDLSAIYQALMTTYPVKHIVQNGVAPTYCEVCKLEHGMGDKNKITLLPPYKGAKAQADVAGLYVGQVFDVDTIKVNFEKDTLKLSAFGQSWKLFPVSETKYFAESFMAPMQFLRDASGNVTELDFGDLGRTYKKVSGK